MRRHHHHHHHHHQRRLVSMAAPASRRTAHPTGQLPWQAHAGTSSSPWCLPGRVASAPLASVRGCCVWVVWPYCTVGGGWLLRVWKARTPQPRQQMRAPFLSRPAHVTHAHAAWPTHDALRVGWSPAPAHTAFPHRFLVCTGEKQIAATYFTTNTTSVNISSKLSARHLGALSTAHRGTRYYSERCVGVCERR